MSIFKRNPDNVAARQAARTERQANRQAARAGRQEARIGNAMDRRDHGVGVGQIAMGLHGQANASAEKFFGVADGGQNQLLGMLGLPGGSPGVGAPGAPPPSLPPWVVPVGIGLGLVGVVLFAVSR